MARPGDLCDVPDAIDDDPVINGLVGERIGYGRLFRAIGVGEEVAPVEGLGRGRAPLGVVDVRFNPAPREVAH